jgi:hypothetical protein
MNDIPGFWRDGPHDPIAVEPSWREFVRSVGGTVIEDELPQTRGFKNADFAFFDSSVIAELKEIETEFSTAPAFRTGFDALMQRLITEHPEWRPALLGATDQYPTWFLPEFVRLFRPPLSRILKKANRQLRDTKAHFNIKSPTGVLLLVNDGFASIGPELVRAQTSELLLHSYSSIDCCIYLTVNRYVEIAGSNEPKLLWVPTYSERASDDLVEFLDKLGRQWFDYLELRIGPFTSRTEISQEANILQGSRSIVLPHENGG